MKYGSLHPIDMLTAELPHEDLFIDHVDKGLLIKVDRTSIKSFIAFTGHCRSVLSLMWTVHQFPFCGQTEDY
jgi:hypothetical protein